MKPKLKSFMIINTIGLVFVNVFTALILFLYKQRVSNTIIITTIIIGGLFLIAIVVYQIILGTRKELHDELGSLQPSLSRRSKTLYILALIILCLAFIFQGFSYLISMNNSESITQVNPSVCTKETKLCSDGSYVSRAGANCEFAECPISEITADSNKTCDYYEYSVNNGHHFSVRSKDISGFACSEPGPYFYCNGYVFKCDTQPNYDCSHNEGKQESIILFELKSDNYSCEDVYMGYQYTTTPEEKEHLSYGYSYLDTPQALEEQFSLLEKATSADSLTDELKNELLNNFSLPKVWGKLANIYVSLIYQSSLDVNGIEGISYNGTDVDLGNYTYWAVFLKDNKIYSVQWAFFSSLESFKALENQVGVRDAVQFFSDNVNKDISSKNQNSIIYQEFLKRQSLVKSIDFYNKIIAE